MKRHRSRRGFTLIEALAAIAVLAIVIPALLQGFDIAGQVALVTQRRAEATALAQSHLEEILATQAWQSGSFGGTDDVGPMHYEWEGVMDQWEAEVGVQQIALTVRWRQRNQEMEVVLTTLVYIPNSTITTTSTLGGGLP